MPLDVYKSLVDALFEVRHALLIGSVASTGAALLTAWKSGETILFAFALAIALLAFFRNRDKRAYAEARPALKTRAEFRRWEHRHALGAAA